MSINIQDCVLSEKLGKYHLLNLVQDSKQNSRFPRFGDAKEVARKKIMSFVLKCEPKLCNYFYIFSRNILKLLWLVLTNSYATKSS